MSTPSPAPRIPAYSQTDLSVDLPITYLHLNPGPDKPLLIFFHGYTDTAAAFVRRAFPHLDERFEILAPNGLFPTPIKNDETWKQAFSWYFVDYNQQRALIPPQVSAQAMLRLVERLNLQDRRKVLLGFSQGGFFLPFIFPQLEKVERLIAIGAAYRSEDYPSQLPVSLDAIHGDQDDVISLHRAQTSFETLRERNLKGTFRSFPGMGHTMNDEARAYLKHSLEDIFR